MTQDWLETVLGDRWRDVQGYSAYRGITLGDAVIELINKGLSHLMCGELLDKKQERI